MLNLFQSNQMTELADTFCNRNGKFDDPFEPLTVIVQSFGLGQWLKLQLAENQGISSNVDCVLPAAFLWRLYQAVLPDTMTLDESPYDRNRLTWRVMRLLKNNPQISDSVATYLSGTGDKDLRLHQLSSELTLLFDDYLMYRPDWILGWENNRRDEQGHEAWQADLWRLISEDLSHFEHLHRAALHQHMIKALSANPQLLWKRLSIFGVSTMPPLQLQSFEALAESMEIDIYFLNPCAHYWGDIASEKDKARRSIRSLITVNRALSDADYLEVGNPILSSLGKQGREYLELLLESNAIGSEESFNEFDDKTALGYVKNDILNLTFGGEFGSDTPPQKSSLKDSTLQVHACHSRLREVEVLYDEILRAASQNPDLKLNDIIVMVPNIADYTPFIQSVFADRLSFRIADRTTLDDSTLLTSFLSLLNLTQSRFTGPDIMDLLETPAIMRRFELSAENLETISYWINHAGIRWEVTGEDKQTHWNLPEEHQNTWRFGLDRLMLGFAMSMEQGSWQGILPFEVSPADTELLAKLHHFIDLLDEYRDLLRLPRTPADWQGLVSRLIAQFFEPHGDEVLDVDRLLQQAEQLANDAAGGDFQDEISGQLVIQLFNQALSAIDTRAGFISGGITFATLVPMRSIPFHMVCLLGMNDGDYPRDVHPHSFDLIASGQQRRGDRSRKLDDRYLFLEALLSAAEMFYVSYVGKGIRDNKDRPPSVVVGEWQSYLADIFENFETTFHSLQPFNRRYYAGDSLQSFSRTWHEALGNTEPARTFVSAPIEPDESLACVSIAQLANFIRHPGKFFMQQHLGVYFEDDEVELKEVEPFQLDNLERYQLADDALNAMVNVDDMNQFRDQVTQSGQILTGSVGQGHLEKEISRAANIYEAIGDYLVEPASRISADIMINGTSLNVNLTHLYGSKLLSYRVGDLRAHQLLSDWINHLAANLTGQRIDTICIHRGRNNRAAITILNSLDAAACETHLEKLLSLYNEGIRSPVFLPPEISRYFVTQFNAQDVLESALTKTRQNWDINGPGAECQDRYWARLFDMPAAMDAQFQDNARELWQPLLDSQADA